MVNAEIVREQIQLRLNFLRDRSFRDLVALPQFSTEHVQLGTRTFTFTTYSQLDGEAVRIIVQAAPEPLGRIWTEVHADGFRMQPSGRIEPVAEKELFEFT